MKYNSRLIIAGLATLMVGSAITAEAGTTHSLGGNSMANARNFSSSHNLGGHNLGSVNRPFNAASKAASYIKAHGGTVTITRVPGQQATVNVTTSKGGSFSGNAVKATNTSTPWYNTSATAKTEKGRTYSGTGSIYKDSFYDGHYQGISAGIDHTGTITGDKRSIDVSKGSQSTYNPNGSSSVGHFSEITGSNNQYSHSGSIVKSASSPNYYVHKNVSVATQENTLEAHVDATVSKVNNLLTVTPNTESSYVLHNGEPIKGPTTQR